jgi:hypothetical protein
MIHVLSTGMLRLRCSPLRQMHQALM